jgi:membrane-bound lytic murein transglycosylase B
VGLGVLGGVMRRVVICLAMLAAPLAQAQEAGMQEAGIQEAAGRVMVDQGSAAGFAAWRAEFRGRALAAGISAGVFDEVMAQAAFLPAVVDRDRRQDEFSKTIWDYLDKAVSEDRIAAGRKALKKHAALFDKIEAKYGVDRYVVLAIWGLESAFGQVRGDISTVSALATLGYEGRRGAFFEAELITLLAMMQKGDVKPGQLIGSWAGAMGHTQFMPSSYARLAVNFDGKGRANIWDEDPTDALASTAAYLANAGWKTGEGWGVEVRLPEGFDYDLAGNRTQKPVSTWRAMGVVPAAGEALPKAGWGAVILPAGARGPAFLVYDNFAAIESYNKADAYVIAVGHLADRIRGGAAFVQSWPRDLRVLTLPEKVELQQHLLDKGLMSGEADGKIGPLTMAALKGFQRRIGVVADGYACLPVLEQLRAH